jgi:two-component system NtrC family sensor kinase
VKHVGEALKNMFDAGSFLIVTVDIATDSQRVARAEGMGDSPSAHDPRIKRTLSEGSVVSSGASVWMGATVTVAGRRFGAICVTPPDHQQFDESDLTALEGVAAVTGVGLQGAHLFELLSVGKREWEFTVDSIPQAFCIVDDSGVVRRGNLAFSELVDVPITAIANRPWRDLVPSHWLEPVGRVLALAVAERVQTDDRVHVVTALKIKRPESRFTVLVFDDVTEKEELQAQLTQSAKMNAIGQLVSGIAHDLNTPLASVIGFADYLVSGDVDIPEHLMRPLGAIRDEALRAGNIVSQLLSFARRQDQTRSPQHVQEVLESTVALMRSQLASCRASATLELDDDLPRVLVNYGQIQQVFVNLVNNAAQSIAESGKDGKITISARKLGNETVEISVSDTGPGVLAEHRDRIFEPFFTTKEGDEGTGLGLSISHGIVSEHGGELTLDPSVADGTTLRVVLPAAADSNDNTRVVSREIPPQRIMVVESEPHIVHYLQATLEAWGHTVGAAANPTEAREVLARFKPDLVICDLRLPEVTGRALYDEIREEHPRLASRVIFTTADALKQDTLAFLHSLGRPYLQKPFTLLQLRAALAAVGAPA